MDQWLRNVGCEVANTGKAIHESLDDFGQKSGKALDAWGKEVGKDLDPSHPIHIAMTRTREFSLDAASGTSRCLGQFGQQAEKTVGDTYDQAYRFVSQVDWDKLSQEARTWIGSTANELGVAISVATKIVLCIPGSHLPKAIAQWITEHPGRTTFIVIAGTVFLTTFIVIAATVLFIAFIVIAGAVVFPPFMITVPVLTAFGFTASGVVTGTAVAVIQLMIGLVQAGSIFSLLQSVGVGGAGLAIVNGLVSTSAGVGVGVVAATCATEEVDNSPSIDRKP